MGRKAELCSINPTYPKLSQYWTEEEQDKNPRQTSCIWFNRQPILFKLLQPDNQLVKKSLNCHGTTSLPLLCPPPATSDPIQLYLPPTPLQLQSILMQLAQLCHTHSQTNHGVGGKMVHYMTCLWICCYYCRTRIPSEGGFLLEIPTFGS